jgi:anti-sigma regulatory factor (Ser/Thr protein kinase)
MPGQAVTFDASVHAVADARQHVERALLAAGLDDPRIDDAVLCTSELCTNALLHAEGPFTVAIDVGECVKVSVVDGHTARLPVLQRPAGTAERGRGLQIVSMLADGWGIDLTDGGKCVWFELLRTSDRDRAAAGAGRRHGDVRAS